MATITNGNYNTNATALQSYPINNTPPTNLSILQYLTSLGQWIPQTLSQIILSVNNSWTGINTFIDTKFSILNNADLTKIFQVSLVGQTTGTTTSLLSQNTVNANITLPNATSTLSTLGLNETITGNKTFQGTNTMQDTKFSIVGSADATKILDFLIGTQTTNTKLDFLSSITANRTQAFQDVTDTFVYRSSTDSLNNKTLINPSITLTKQTFNTNWQGIWAVNQTGNLQYIFDGARVTLFFPVVSHAENAVGLITNVTTLTASLIPTSNKQFPFIIQDNTIYLNGVITIGSAGTITIWSTVINTGSTVQNFTGTGTGGFPAQEITYSLI